MLHADRPRRGPQISPRIEHLHLGEPLGHRLGRAVGRAIVHDDDPRSLCQSRELIERLGYIFNTIICNHHNSHSRVFPRVFRVRCHAPQPPVLV